MPCACKAYRVPSLSADVVSASCEGVSSNTCVSVQSYASLHKDIDTSGYRDPLHVPVQVAITTQLC